MASQLRRIEAVLGGTEPDILSFADMNKVDEYRAHAAECERMARAARNLSDKATWLKMAADWLRMIPQPRRSASDKFDAAEKAHGTGQLPSESEH